MRSQLIPLSLACLFVLPRTVHSQTTLSPPPLELGGSVGLGMVVGNGSGLLFTVGPRLTINATSRDAVEIVADADLGSEIPGLRGWYLIQYKRLLRPRQLDRPAIFLTAGLGGDFHYRRIPEWRSERPDGSIYVQPAHTYAELGKVSLGAIGVGFDQTVNRRVVVRSEVQVGVTTYRTLGVRGTVGVMFPIGGYREE